MYWFLYDNGLRHERFKENNLRVAGSFFMLITLFENGLLQQEKSWGKGRVTMANKNAETQFENTILKAWEKEKSNRKYYQFSNFSLSTIETYLKGFQNTNKLKK